VRTHVVVIAVITAACGTTGGSETIHDPVSGVPSDAVASVVVAEGCAHVDVVSVTPRPDGRFTVAATVRSADTGEDKYADRWEVRSADGSVLGERILLHPHVGEQPFTRSLDGLVIPPAVGSIEVFAHDSVAGFCGTTVVADVP